MELDITAGKFIEHGEYKGHLYGTSGESVKSIVNSGCVCVLSPHYQAIKALRTPQLKPYIIHIKPPQFDELKKTRTSARALSTFDETNSRGFSVSFDNFFNLGLPDKFSYNRTKNSSKWKIQLRKSILCTVTFSMRKL